MEYATITKSNFMEAYQDEIVDIQNLIIAINVTKEAKNIIHVKSGRARNSLMYKVSTKNGEKVGGFNDHDGEQALFMLDYPIGRGEGIVGGNLNYLIYLEFGTRKMPPYPFLIPAIENVLHDSSLVEEIKKQHQQWMEEHLPGVKIKS